MDKKKIPRKHKPQKTAKSKYTELVDIDSNANIGIQNASGAFVEKLLGSPTSKEVLNMIKYSSVGPFKVEGLAPALNSLNEIMSDVKDKYSDLYPRLSHNGMRVVKKIAQSSSKSLHSWGIAIDIKVDGIDDEKWNEKAFYGLALLAPIFHKHGWYWGGAFRDKPIENKPGFVQTNEDAMHFEVSKGKLLGWAQLGLLGPDAQKFATKKETLKLQRAVIPAKSKEDLTSRVFAGQAIKPPSNPLAPTQLPQSNHFVSLLKQRPEETFPSWYGKNGWVTKVRSGVSWFRK